MKIVFDTNVIVSALLIKSSNSRFAYEKSKLKVSSEHTRDI